MTCCLWAVVLLSAGSLAADSGCAGESLSLLQTQFVGVRSSDVLPDVSALTEWTEVGADLVKDIRSDLLDRLTNCEWCVCKTKDVEICGSDMVQNAILCGSAWTPRWVTDGAKCGWHWVSNFVTSAHHCGTSAVKKCTFDQEEDQEDEEIALIKAAGRRRDNRRRQSIVTAVKKALKCVTDNVANYCDAGGNTGANSCDVGSEIAQSCAVAKSCYAIRGAKACVKEVIAAAIPFGEKLADKVSVLWDEFVETATDLWNEAVDFFQDIGNFISDVFEKFVQPPLDAVAGGFMYLLDFIAGIAETVWNLVKAVSNVLGSLLDLPWLECDTEGDTEVVDSVAFSMPNCLPGFWMLFPGSDTLDAFASLGKITTDFFNAQKHWNDCKTSFGKAFEGYRNDFFQFKIGFFATPPNMACLDWAIDVLDRFLQAMETLLSALAHLGEAMMQLSADLGFLPAVQRAVQKRREDPNADLSQVLGESAPEAALASVEGSRRRRRRSFNRNANNLFDSARKAKPPIIELGCFHDKPIRAFLTNHLGYYKGNTDGAQRCMAKAQELNHRWFGLQYATNRGSQCFSSDNLADAQRYGSTTCGGGGDSWKNYIYECPAQDTDKDGFSDNVDVFPDDPSEHADTDGDGTGNNADVFPDDPSEHADRDGDGTGNNADLFPDDPSEHADFDGDGFGDNIDAYPDDPSKQFTRDVPSGIEWSVGAVSGQWDWTSPDQSHGKDPSYCKSMEDCDRRVADICGDWHITIGLYIGLWIDSTQLPFTVTFNSAKAMWAVFCRYIRGLIPRNQMYYVGFQLSIGCRFATFVDPQYSQTFWIFWGLLYMKTVTPADFWRYQDEDYGYSYGVFFQYWNYGYVLPISVSKTCANAVHRIGIYLSWAFGMAFLRIGGDPLPCQPSPACKTAVNPLLVKPSFYVSHPLIPYDWMNERKYHCSNSQKCDEGQFDEEWCRVWDQYGDDSRKQVRSALGDKKLGGGTYLSMDEIGKNPLWSVMKSFFLDEDGNMNTKQVYETMAYETDVSEVFMSTLGRNGAHPTEGFLSALFTSQAPVPVKGPSFPFPGKVTTGISPFIDFCLAATNYGSWGHHCAGQFQDPVMMFKDFAAAWAPPMSFRDTYAWSDKLIPSIDKGDAGSLPTNSGGSETLGLVETDGGDFWGTDGDNIGSEASGSWAKRAWSADVLTKGGSLPADARGPGNPMR